MKTSLFHGKKGFIFDHDGTIADTERLWFMAEKKILQEAHIDLDQAASDHLYHAMLGTSVKHGAVLLKNMFQLPHSIEEIMLLKIRYAQELYHTELSFIEGVEIVLSDLKKKLSKMAIASNSDHESLMIASQKLQLSRFFEEHIYDTSMVKNVKPAPDLYQLAMERLEVHPHECIAFEDSGHGIASALSAGISVVIAINSAGNKKALEKAHLIIDSYHQLYE